MFPKCSRISLTKMLHNMQQTYRQGLQSGASERMKKHYRYMLLAIERALKVE